MPVTGPIPVNTAATARPDDPKRVHEAAQQFESFLIAEMLKTEREGGGGWLGTGDDAPGGTAVEMAEQEFAQALGKQGGLGLARLVESGLNRANEASIARSQAQKGEVAKPKSPAH